MNKMKTLMMVIGLAIGLITFSSGYAGHQATDVATLEDPANPPGTAGGGDIPTPFGNANQKVELADGEIYILNGKVEFIVDEPYFKVDLKKHTWLANANRVADPYYLLLGPTGQWTALKDKQVQITVKAHGVIEEFTGMTSPPRYTVQLESQAEPVGLDGGISR